MTNFPGSTSDLEAADLLRDKVAEALKIAEHAHSALKAQIPHFEEAEPELLWPRVHAILATRMADDVRTAAGLVLRGYFAQAMTLGASVYELAYMASYIGTDDDRANEWLHWHVPWKLPWTIRNMVQEVRTEVFGPEHASQRDTRYMGLCWAKHGNPTLLRQLGVAATPEAHVLNVDPSLGNNAHRLGEVALWSMIEPVIVYLSSLHLAGQMERETAVQVSPLIDGWKVFDARIWPRDK